MICIFSLVQRIGNTRNSVTVVTMHCIMILSTTPTHVWYLRSVTIHDLPHPNRKKLFSFCQAPTRFLVMVGSILQVDWKQLIHIHVLVMLS